MSDKSQMASISMLRALGLDDQADGLMNERMAAMRALSECNARLAAAEELAMAAQELSATAEGTDDDVFVDASALGKLERKLAAFRASQEAK